ncbi:MAG: [protein-PII] uridylyltransferase [Candidatus Vesicomyosocius endoextente]|uniref:Bifunctional uridylyltransferase/uridylyl-removing enzyme n=1 Tax=Candidatus Vesicomyosocius endoextente TaxID=2738853 RepID=A0A853G5W6_9GAMM|nr:[protein-PII] uridylyltransferase [Candidatus Vesicomyosocius endoextente]
MIDLSLFKAKYQSLQESIKKDFLNSPETAQALVLYRSNEIDQLLKDIWQSFNLSDQLCLVAVGGYGRKELHPYSDIDLLILIPDDSHNTYQHGIASFLTFLWDVNLEVGHATRDLKDCISVINDLSVVTNLLESRVILGKVSLFYKMKAVIKSSVWSSQTFLVGKKKEQYNRHQNPSNTAYNLEPNIKQSSGGLRDIQTVVWVAKWYFCVNTLFELIDKQYLTIAEYELLNTSQLFLFKVRFALHIIANRHEDRLVFQYQKSIATILGYVDGDFLAVEVFMKDYYQTVTKVSRLNDILLQLLEDEILNTQFLNSRFMVNHGYIHSIDERIFIQIPSAFIEIFLLIAKHSYVCGISAKTLRQMQTSINLIDCDYYKRRNNNRLFIELLQQNQGVNKALKLMNRYGILERYIPNFGKIMGLMQYDLFHAYTVDQHTLFVIRNLRRFFVSEFAKEFILCSEIAVGIQKPELLLLAGLFHDIAKGRGRSREHAKLGAIDVRKFCQYHQLKANDIDLVSQLVEKHLLMSMVAQKQDIGDFEVIKYFAEQVSTVEFLEFLYLLTVADIRATKDNLWNSWKDSLLKKLFYNTKKYLESSNGQRPSVDQRVQDIKQTIINNSIIQGYPISEVEKILSTLPKDYYLRYDISDILWHLNFTTKMTVDKIIVSSKISQYNVVDIFILCNDFKGLFFKLISILERLGLDIVDAKILTTKNNKVYNTISVLQDEVLKHININQKIKNELDNLDVRVRITHDIYMYQYFDHRVKVSFSLNEQWNLTQLEINALDKQGILSNIAYVFFELNILLINARIATMGERVEDVFFISNSKNEPLSMSEKLTLKESLEEKL